MKKALRIICAIIVIIILAITVFLLVCFFSQKSARKDAREILTSRGLCSMASAGDIELNVPVFGSDQAEHTVVCLPGSGDSTFSPAMHSLFNYAHGCRFAVIERPGYGLSDTGKKDMTAEYVVECSRKALKSAGIEAPYVLMPHSLGGIYAEYWVSTYPDEIEGMLLLDTVYPGQELMSEPETTGTKLWTLYNQLGVERMLGSELDSPLAKLLPEEEQNSARLLLNYSPVNSSLNSEAALNGKNLSTVDSVTASSPCPKVFISTDVPDRESFRKTLQFTFDASGIELTDEILDRRYEEYLNEHTDEQLAVRADYLNRLGNTTVVNIPASHFVYLQYPEAVAQELEKLLADIDKKE